MSAFIAAVPTVARAADRPAPRAVGASGVCAPALRPAAAASLREPNRIHAAVRRFELRRSTLAPAAGARARFDFTVRANAGPSAAAPAAPAFNIYDVIERIKKDGMAPFEGSGESSFDIYDDDVYYQDPTSKVWGKPQFLAMVNNLKKTAPECTLKFLKMEPTGGRTIRARWTMSFANPASWKMPFWITGETTYTLNEAGRVIAHVDSWDSLAREPKPWEALVDMTKQILREQVMKKARVSEPPSIVVRRFAEYEVREYERFLEAETPIAGNPLGGSSAFQSLAGYIFGRNEREEKMAMTAPVFSTYEGPDAERASRMAFVMESSSTAELPRPADASVKIVERPKARFAVIKFGGVALGPVVRRQKQRLLELLQRDGIAVAPGGEFRLAQYNDPSTPPYRRRNEVLVPVSLDD